MQQIREELNKALEILMTQRQQLYEKQPDEEVDNPIAEAATAVDDAQELVRLAVEKIKQGEKYRALPPGTYKAVVSEVTLDEDTGRLRISFTALGHEGQQFEVELHNMKEEE